MKLPVRWLKKYIDVTLSPEKLEEILTMSGSKVECIEKKGPEAVIEIEVTTNRPDCLSILGLAHDVSALTGKKVSTPKSYSKNETAPKKAPKLFEISVEDKKACPLYTARLIQNVRITGAPEETAALLDLAGTRAINNAVDATNFVLFESGQPLHAFDFDKIQGGKIVVRHAKKDEKFLGIDGIEYTLDEKTLVIADAARAIAIAGVIGGKLTEVTSSTKNILLESAYFDPALVRRASRKYKISTDSSYRFERGVDPAGIAPASRRAAELILEWGGGEDVSGLVEKNSMPKDKKSDLVLRVSRVQRLLGLAVPQARILGIFKKLSLDARVSGKDKVLVRRSSFRRDLEQEADLIEEVLRIEGFEKIPSVIPPVRYNEKDPQVFKAQRLPEVKKFLAALGFSEIITYSLISAKLLKEAGFEAAKTHRVVNTIGAGQEFFRPSLLPGMLETALFNIHRKSAGFRLFEAGDCYREAREEAMLGLLIYGSFENDWRKKNDATFYDLKGIAGNLLQSAGIRADVWSDEEKIPGLDQSSAFSKDGKVLARLGRVSAAAQKSFDIPHEVFYAEIALDAVLNEPAAVLRVRPVPKFPLVKRDLAIVVDEKIRVADLENLMRDNAAPHLRDVVLFDQYLGKNIAAGKRSLAFSLSYQKETGTFTDAEIQALQERVGQALKSRYGAEFR